VAACTGSIGMHRRSTEADRADRADRASSEYKVLEAVKTVRTCQNSLGQNGTHLELLLPLVGPNGDRFGGQAFMEHYSGEYLSTEFNRYLKDQGIKRQLTVHHSPQQDSVAECLNCMLVEHA
jgi:hypothetical protein